MKKPDEAIQKAFNADRIFFLDEKSIEDPFFEGVYLSVNVMIGLPNTGDITAPEFSLSVITPRGVAMLFTDWGITQNDDQRALSFKASVRVPNNTPMRGITPRYMSFMDMCYFTGNEAIPEVYGTDINTKPLAGFDACDLGWLLPSRFIDHFVDSFSKIDRSLLSGLGEEALVYGPYVRQSLQ